MLMMPAFSITFIPLPCVSVLRPSVVPLTVKRIVPLAPRDDTLVLSLFPSAVLILLTDVLILFMEVLKVFT